jgi:putative cell wall-binding protein
MSRSNPLTHTLGFRALALCLVTTLTLVLLPATAGAADSPTSAEVRLAELLNAERAKAGLRPLRIDVRLVGSARSWAQQMARDGRLSHDPDLRSEVPQEADAWAENVGRATDGTDAVHRSFMSSDGHRRHMLSTRYTDVGIGAEVRDGQVWVTQRFTSGAPARVAPAVVPTSELARNLFPAGARHAVVVRDDAFPDALAAGPLAGAAGPVLYTPPGPVLHPEVRLALEEILAPGGTVWVVGGTAAVSDGVARELSTAGWSPRRLAGDHRVATAAAVARSVAGPEGRADTVLLATGADWPDAASAGAYGAHAATPVLLAYRDELPPETAAALRDLAPARVVALGGPAALSEAVVQQAGAGRVSGADRQETAAAVAEELWGRKTAADAARWTAVPAGGDGWSWALGAAPLAARRDAAVLLARDPLTAGLRAYLEALGYGGDRRAGLQTFGPVDSGAVTDLRRLLNAG